MYGTCVCGHSKAAHEEANFAAQENLGLMVNLQKTSLVFPDQETPPKTNVEPLEEFSMPPSQLTVMPTRESVFDSSETRAVKARFWVLVFPFCIHVAIVVK